VAAYDFVALAAVFSGLGVLTAAGIAVLTGRVDIT